MLLSWQKKMIWSKVPLGTSLSEHVLLLFYYFQKRITLIGPVCTSHLFSGGFFNKILISARISEGVERLLLFIVIDSSLVFTAESTDLLWKYTCRSSSSLLEVKHLMRLYNLTKCFYWVKLAFVMLFKSWILFLWSNTTLLNIKLLNYFENYYE